MIEVAILIPSRNRPNRLAATIDSIFKHSYPNSEYGITVYVGLDEDDPNLGDYTNMSVLYGSTHVRTFQGERRSLSAWTNDLALFGGLSNGSDYFVSMGDDHIVKTTNWHVKLVEAIKKLDGPGFAYGNDGTNFTDVAGKTSPLCTYWMASSTVVKALGWMMLPDLDHLYVDNVIMALGEETNRLIYVPEVEVTHYHPAHNMAEWDLSYRESNSPQQYDKDYAKYVQWMTGYGIERDKKKIKRLVY